MSVPDPRRKSLTVGGLQPNREYVLSVSALTRQGPGLAASIAIRTRPNCERHHRRRQSQGDGARPSLNTLPSSPLCQTPPTWRRSSRPSCCCCSAPFCCGPREMCESGRTPSSPRPPREPHTCPVCHFSSRVKTRLVGIFTYPAGMKVRAPDLDSFLLEVQT